MGIRKRRKQRMQMRIYGKFFILKVKENIYCLYCWHLIYSTTGEHNTHKIVCRCEMVEEEERYMKTPYFFYMLIVGFFSCMFYSTSFVMNSLFGLNFNNEMMLEML